MEINQKVIINCDKCVANNQRDMLLNNMVFSRERSKVMDSFNDVKTEIEGLQVSITEGKNNVQELTEVTPMSLTNSNKIRKWKLELKLFLLKLPKHSEIL